MLTVNDGVRFILEMCALIAVGYWGWRNGHSLASRLELCVGSVLAVAIVWGVFRADAGATVEVSTAVRIVIEVAVSTAATAALVARGKTRWAVAFAVLAAVNEVLNYTLDSILDPAGKSGFTPEAESRSSGAPEVSRNRKMTGTTNGSVT